MRITVVALILAYTSQAARRWETDKIEYRRDGRTNDVKLAAVLLTISRSVTPLWRSYPFLQHMRRSPPSTNQLNDRGIPTREDRRAANLQNNLFWPQPNFRRRLLLLGSMLGVASATPGLAADAPACIDVDTASAKDLESLKGVGPSISKRIIDYRKNERTAATKDGRKTWNFQNWATLMKVDGVSQQICVNNIQQVCFGGRIQKACPMSK